MMRRNHFSDDIDINMCMYEADLTLCLDPKLGISIGLGPRDIIIILIKPNKYKYLFF